jgi:hypothetical protein
MNHDSEDSEHAGQPEGRYANYFKVGHNAFEFLFDFGQFYPENGEARFHTRIITAPIYAKAVLTILGESVARYEQTFGAIPQENENDPVEGGQHGG